MSESGVPTRAAPDGQLGPIMRLVATTVLCSVCALPVVAAEGAEDVEQAEPRREVAVAEDTLYAVPEPEIRAVGLPYESIPDDENAATLCLQAINALPPYYRGLADQLDAAASGGLEAADGAFAEWFEHTQEARDLARQAMARTRIQIPVLDYSEEGGPFIFALADGIFAGRMRRLAEVLVTEGRETLRAMKPQEALAAYLDAFRIGSHAAVRPSPIEALIAIQIQTIARQAIRDGIRRQELSAEDLSWLADELREAERGLPDPTAWIPWERASARQSLSMPLSVIDALGSELSAIHLIGSEIGASRRRAAILDSRAVRILYPDRTVLKEADAFFDALQAILSRPPWEAAVALEAAEDDRPFLGKVGDWNVLTQAVLPSYEGIARRHWLGAADHAALRIEVALRLFSREHGRWPDALDQLVPDFIAELPLDPFSGEPFRYQPEGDGWLLYSVGPNLTDDGGLEDADPPNRGDIVYRPTEKEDLP